MSPSYRSVRISQHQSNQKYQWEESAASLSLVRQKGEIARRLGLQCSACMLKRGTLDSSSCLKDFVLPRVSDPLSVIILTKTYFILRSGPLKSICNQSQRTLITTFTATSSAPTPSPPSTSSPYGSQSHAPHSQAALHPSSNKRLQFPTRKHQLQTAPPPLRTLSSSPSSNLSPSTALLPLKCPFRFDSIIPLLLARRLC
ncbi:hypothetical protein N431DRAFT_226740 [Stipitochalara longipes BDJ]|nr:hypothetical protein N431DRAFT_226740 [Stipitochalara longipes BDJ]